MDLRDIYFAVSFFCIMCRFCYLRLRGIYFHVLGYNMVCPQDTDWGECDADCGDGGNQTRDVTCVAVTPGDAIEWENVIEIVSVDMCVLEDMLPTR